MAFVADASIALAWHFQDQTTTATDAIFARTLDEDVVVPAHWFLEVGNAALVGERRSRSTPANTAELHRRIDDLLLDVDEAPGIAVLTRILPLARAHGLTMYDALYLELAERRGLPLATLDDQLANAARKVGLEVLP